MGHAAPRWFRAALAESPDHRETVVDGGRIHLRCWGAQGLPGLVFVHGGSANSGWWDHIAPLFAREYRVVALDLSGHGDSAWRDSYGLKEWAQEVFAATEAGGIDGPVSVIGHSMGGWVTATAGALAGERLNGIVIIDSPLNDQPPEEERMRQRLRAPKVYPDRDTILSRFTAVPPQEVLLPYVRAHIAEESVRPVEGGWTWKFDPSMFGQGRRLLLRELLPEVRCRVGYLRSEFGIVSPEMAAAISELLGHRALIAELPDAGHHPMLDQPLPLVTALRTLLAGWALEDRKSRM